MHAVRCVPIVPEAIPAPLLLPYNQVEPAAFAPMGTFLSGEDDG